MRVLKTFFDWLKTYLLLGAIFIGGLILTLALPMLIGRFELLRKVIGATILISGFVFFMGVALYKLRNQNESLLKNVLLLPWRFISAYVKLIFKTIPGMIVCIIVNLLAWKLIRFCGFHHFNDYQSSFWDLIGIVMMYTIIEICIWWLLFKLSERL